MNRETVERLIEGNLPWPELKNEVLPDPKDQARFETVIDVLESKVDWDEPILVPLNEHLFVVQRGDDRVVKAECGQEFGPASDNWKHASRIRVRESDDEMGELYPDWQTPDPEWSFQIREFFCPGCFRLLDVDAVPAGYPVFLPFEPDIDAFYEGWVDRAPPDR